MVEKRFGFLLLFLTTVTAVLLWKSEVARPAWVFFVFLCFTGILVFDLQNQCLKTWERTLGFATLFFTMQMAVVSESVEEFWRTIAGAFFLLSLLYEQNSGVWSGPPIRYGAFMPALLFLILSNLQGASFVSPEVAMASALFAFVLLAIYEIFLLFRHKSESVIGTYVSSLRMAVSGLAGLFYAHVFLPSIFKEEFFSGFILLLPGLAVALAFISLFSKDIRRRHVLFTSSWSLLILWGVLSGDSERFYAASLACLFGAWSQGMMSVGGHSVKSAQETFLYLAGWCLPGSFLFSAFVFLLYPSETPLVRLGCVIWLIVMALFSQGLTGFNWTLKPREGGWAWQQKAAVVTNILGICLLGLIHFLPELGLRYWEGLK